jgi:hypothetical protein
VWSKKQLIAVWVISILISTTFYGSVYSGTKRSRVVKTSYAPNFFDKILYKKVTLPGSNSRAVLVNRLTGEVKYLLVNDKRWILLTGMWKKQYQARYDTQAASKNKPEAVLSSERLED